MARLLRVWVPVSNIEVDKRFYTRVLGAEGRRVPPGRHYFDCGGTSFARFDACAAAGATFASGSSSMVGPLGETAKRPWGEESFYVSDPFGNPLCFVA